jgi:hypothetical protein
MVPIEDAWFSARLELPSASEGPDRAGARRRAIRVPTLLYGVLDDQGQEVVLDPELRVEVDSPELGRAVWEVTALPVPMRRKQEVIGWEVQLSRVEDREFDPDADLRQAVGRSLSMPYVIAGPPPAGYATAHLRAGQY